MNVADTLALIGTLLGVFALVGFFVGLRVASHYEEQRRPPRRKR